MFKVLILALVLFINAINCEGKNKISIAGNTDTIELILGFEICEPYGRKQFSKCSDGYEQLYGIPTFVDWSMANNVLFNMDSYSFDSFSFNETDSVFERLAKVESLIQPDQIVSLYCGHRFKRRINKRVRELKKVGMYGVQFDGRLYYALFRVKLIRKYIGVRQKAAPNIRGNQSSPIIKSVLTKHYFIEKILAIEKVR